MARDCAIGCPEKVRKSLSYLYSSFVGLDVVFMGRALYLKPWDGVGAAQPSPWLCLMLGRGFLIQLVGN